MSALDAKIDELYQRPPGEFTAARNALAKTLKGDDAKLVKALAKPAAVPWAVNQLYWHARSAYERLMKSGQKLRAAQIAALEGRHGDVRAAGDAHRRAIGEAVAEAERLAATAGVKPGADALARTFESLSLAPSAQTAGRLTEALQPAGFEALLGVSPSEVRSSTSEVRRGQPELVTSGGPRTRNDERLAKAAADAAAKAAAEKTKHEAAVKKAEEKLADIESAERDARTAWEKAHDDLLAARQTLTDLRRSRFRST